MRLHRYSRSDRSGLYRIYDANDRFIYVGISYDPRTRIQQHRVRQSWGIEIARYTVEWFDDRAACEAAEATIIRAEKPPHNDHPGHVAVAEPVAVEQMSPTLAAVVDAYNLIGLREQEYRAVLRRKLAARDVRQADVAKRLGRTREMIRRDAMPEEKRDALRGVPAAKPS